MWGIKHKFIPGIGGIIGLVLGIRIMGNVDNLLGLIIVGVAFFQLYMAVFSEEKK